MYGDPPVNEPASRASQINEIAGKFDRDPAKILAALAAYMHETSTEEQIVAILALSDIQNITFPPNEIRGRWRFCYARAVLSGNTARLTSRIFGSSSDQKFTALAGESRLLTINRMALRECIGPRAFDRAQPTVLQLSSATKAMMAFRIFAEQSFERGDFQLRPHKDWVEFAMECMVQFTPAALAEFRIERFPWEALPAPTGSFLAEVRDTAHRIRDPTLAIRQALAPPQ